MSDFSKMTLGGTLSYEPANAGDKWVYLETIADGTSSLLIQAGAQYSERYIRTDGTETETATGDIVRWIAVKNTGTTDGSTATSSGVVLSLEGSAAYNNTDGIFIDKDIYLMGFHPETEANDLLDDSEFETELDALYGMIFIQRLSLLCNASEKLMSKGYYERNHGNYDVQAILAKRKELYGRLKSG